MILKKTAGLLAVSDLFSQIGMDGIDIGYLFIGLAAAVLILLILLIVQIAQYKKLKKRLDRFMLGKDGGSLEEDIAGLYEDNKKMKESTDANKKDIRVLYKDMESAFQKFGVVKYDAFRQMGGQLSFSIAMLNQKNDGFLLNCMHGADGCYSYTKEIRNGECSLELGEEEKKALDTAMGQ